MVVATEFHTVRIQNNDSQVNDADTIDFWHRWLRKLAAENLDRMLRSNLKHNLATHQVVLALPMVLVVKVGSTITHCFTERWNGNSVTIDLSDASGDGKLKLGGVSREDTKYIMAAIVKAYADQWRP